MPSENATHNASRGSASLCACAVRAAAWWVFLGRTPARACQLHVAVSPRSSLTSHTRAETEAFQLAVSGAAGRQTQTSACARHECSPGPVRMAEHTGHVRCVVSRRLCLGVVAGGLVGFGAGSAGARSDEYYQSGVRHAPLHATMHHARAHRHNRTCASGSCNANARCKHVRTS